MPKHRYCFVVRKHGRKVRLRAVLVAVVRPRLDQFAPADKLGVDHSTIVRTKAATKGITTDQLHDIVRTDLDNDKGLKLLRGLDDEDKAKAIAGAVLRRYDPGAALILF